MYISISGIARYINFTSSVWNIIEYFIVKNISKNCVWQSIEKEYYFTCALKNLDWFK